MCCPDEVVFVGDTWSFCGTGKFKFTLAQVSLNSQIIQKTKMTLYWQLPVQPGWCTYTKNEKYKLTIMQYCPSSVSKQGAGVTQGTDIWIVSIMIYGSL